MNMNRAINRQEREGTQTKAKESFIWELRESTPTNYLV
jgi:hypothetical protein